MSHATVNKSLQWHTFVRITPAAITAILIVILFCSFQIFQTLRQEVQNRVDATANHAANQTELKLDGIVEACQAMAINDMVVNGIVDLEHRQTVLQSFFRSLKLPGPRDQQVSMTDYRGRILASTASNKKSYGDESWFPNVMSGERFVGAKKQELLIAVPVLYANRAEGTVIATFAFDDFLAQQAAASEVGALVFHDSGSVAFSTEQRFVASEDFSPPPNSLFSTVEINRLPNLKVSYLEAKDSGLIAVKTATNSQLIQMAILIGGLIFTIWLAARMVTKPLERLLEQIAMIQNTRDLNLRVEESGSREIVDLGRGFNAMLCEVQKSTVSIEEYRISEDRLEAAIRGTNDGLWDWEIETGNIWYAPGYKKLLGYNDCENEFPNTLKTFEDHLHPNDSKPTWDAIANHLEKDSEFDIEQRIKTKSGSYRWFRARAAGIRNAAGKVIRMAGSIQDISERKKFEEALRQSNHDLEQFAYIASHDLQEPLRKVASFCELLRQDYWDQIDAEGRQYLDFAVDGACRMRSLIQDLLLYAKIGSEKKQNAKAKSETALNDAIVALDSAIVESNATITRGSLPEVYADGREIAQVFQNVIGNAIKYRSDSPPEIHVSAIESKEFWTFSVADNGIGIESEYRERIFGIFKRLHTRKKYAGTGIGLAICKRIIDQLGGIIWAEPTPVQGCTICFTIPKASFKYPHHTEKPIKGPDNEHVPIK